MTKFAPRCGECTSYMSSIIKGGHVVGWICQECGGLLYLPEPTGAQDTATPRPPRGNMADIIDRATNGNQVKAARLRQEISESMRTAARMHRAMQDKIDAMGRAWFVTGIDPAAEEKS